MKIEYENVFTNLIVAPLQQVTGQILCAVNYYIIWGAFDPETPNECGGCQGIHLIFDGSEVELDWAFDYAFRGGEGGIVYHMIASDHSIRYDAVRSWTEDNISGLNLIPATATHLWRDIVGKSLMRVEVLGEQLDETRCSPQAVRLYFPSGSVIVAVGMTHEDDQPICVGDGNEILVFSEQTWATLPDQGVSGINTLICCWDWPN